MMVYYGLLAKSLIKRQEIRNLVEKCAVPRPQLQLFENLNAV